MAVLIIKFKDLKKTLVIFILYLGISFFIFRGISVCVKTIIWITKKKLINWNKKVLKYCQLISNCYKLKILVHNLKW